MISGRLRWRKHSEVRQVCLRFHFYSLMVRYPAPDDIKNAARAWIDKLCVKNGAYPPDSYPNPGMYSYPDTRHHNPYLCL